jgi:dTDP-D-glucose 4,6-dehydratase
MKSASTTGEIDTQYMDFKTVKRDFGWQPKTSFDDGLRQTIDWFEGYLRIEKGLHS